MHGNETNAVSVRVCECKQPVPANEHRERGEPANPGLAAFRK
jgi:hypothetical protein